jgi:DNA-binding response OmpR family regulator
VIRIDDYIIKPFSSHRLLESISRVLAARTK